MNVHGRAAPVSDLSDDEAGNPFFGPTFALRPGHVFQSRPYVSPDTHDWVIGNATPLAVGRAAAPAIVHYELSVESLRQDLGGSDDAFVLRVVDATSGRVIIDGRRPQRVAAPLGAPSDQRFEGFARTAKSTGVTVVGGRTSAYRRLQRSDGNANEWILVASSASATPSWIAGLGVLPGSMLALALLMLPFSALSLGRSRRELESAASTDSSPAWRIGARWSPTWNAGCNAGQTPRHARSRCSTSTASRATTTRSAISPATPCCNGWAAPSPAR